MKPVEQTEHHRGRGDCQRAVFASLLHLEISQVPHFRLFDDGQWFDVLYWFCYSLGWEYTGHVDVDPCGDEKIVLDEADSFDGYFYAVVNSRSFEGCTHAVVMDMNGVVVHDPSPAKKHQGENIIETRELVAYWMFKRRVEAA